MMLVGVGFWWNRSTESSGAYEEAGKAKETIQALPVPTAPDAQRVTLPEQAPQYHAVTSTAPKGHALFETRKDYPLPAIEHPSILSRSAITVDWEAIETVKEAGVGTLEIDTEKQGRMTAQVDRVLENHGGGYTLAGHLEGYPDSSFMATVYEDALVARGSTGGKTNGTFEILTNPEGVQEIREIDTALFPEVCAGEIWPETKEHPHEKAPQTAAYPPPVALAEDTHKEPEMAAFLPGFGQTVIDVMIVYTANARIVAGGRSAMLATISQAINESNAAFSSSQIAATFRLAHSVEINYTETMEADTDLEHLRFEDDGVMDNIHLLRRIHAADIVSLWTSSEYGGIGYLMTRRTGDSARAFNVCGIPRWSGISWVRRVFAHECGHNLGCAHDQENSQGPGLYSYSYGWRWWGNDFTQYRDIMSYPPGMDAHYFSNPNVFYKGTATGTAEADNARTINNSKSVVASYYGSGLTSSSSSSSSGSIVPLSNYARLSELSAEENGSLRYRLSVPSGQRMLVIETFGGYGDCDLYVRRGMMPTTDIWDYSSHNSDNGEKVQIWNPEAGDYYILLYAYNDFGELTLNASYTTNDSGCVTTDVAFSSEYYTALGDGFVFNSSTGSYLFAGYCPFVYDYNSGDWWYIFEENVNPEGFFVYSFAYAQWRFVYAGYVLDI